MRVCQDSTVEEAVERLRVKGCLQPCLFRIADNFYLKADNTAIPLPSAGCFVEAAEYLMMTFWVFSVEYPAVLRVFYSFLERLMDIGSPKNSAVVRDLFCALADVDE